MTGGNIYSHMRKAMKDADLSGHIHSLCVDYAAEKM